jgi:hypothetical protein
VMGDPEISFGSGKSLIVLKGRDAIRAAGWALRFLLFARGASNLLLSTAVVVACAILKWWLTG